MSPKNLGTTIVWYLTEPTLDEATTWTDKPDVRPLSLSIDESADYAEIAHLARHHDGAFLVAPDGVIRSLAGQLTYTHPTATLLSSYRGTRHTSAKYYSYEHPAAMVFVTSEDGGVSVFSDGAKLADSPVLPAGPPWLGLFKGVPADALWPMAALHDQEPDEAKPILSEFSQTTCDQCGKTLAIQILTMAGTIHENTVSCPICDKSGVYTATCLGLKATPLKNI